MNPFEIRKIEIIHEMSRAKSNKVINVFRENFNMLRNIDVIFVNKANNNSAMLKLRNEYIIKYGSFDTPFDSDNLYLLNCKNVLRDVKGLSVKVKYFFDINLDTQVVSYLDKIKEGIELGEMKYEVANLFVRKRNFMSTVSISPYIVENTLFQNEFSNDVKRTIYHFFEEIYLNNSKNDKSAINQTNKHIKRILYNNIYINNDSVTWVLKRMFYIIYSCFLKMYLIQIMIKGYKNKVIEFVRFMADDLQKITVPETILALNFFKSGQKIGFFGKYQKGNANIIKDIKNTVWDVFHIRSLEYIMIFLKHKKADLTIPLFYSIDKRLNEVRNLIKLKMIVLDNNSKNFYTFYCNDIFDESIKEFHLENKFSLLEMCFRYDHFSFDNVLALISKMESEINQLNQ